MHKINPYYPLPENRGFRIGIIGSGFIVNDCHLVSYRKEGLNPVAIASRTAAAAREVAARHEIPTVHETVDQLLEDRSIEVLDVAVPPAAQLEVIEKACHAGTVKGILAQKPLGVNLEEARRIVTACENAGIVLSVNQNGRYDPSIRAMKMALDQGLLGEPVIATIDMRGIPHWMPWQADLGWVTLRIMSIHHMDAFRYWFGNPERIYTSVRTDPRTAFPHTDGICTYILEYPNGLRCISIDDTWTGPAREGGPADIRIQWRMEGLLGTAMGDIGWCRDPYTTPSTMRLGCIGDSDFINYKWDRSWFPDAFGGTMSQLLIALENDTEPEISARDNLHTMALVEAAYQSADEHRAIALSELID
jgi:hypothetical protein